MASFHKVYKAKAHAEGTKPMARRKNITLHPWSCSLMFLVLKMANDGTMIFESYTMVHVRHSPVMFFTFTIYHWLWCLPNNLFWLSEDAGNRNKNFKCQKPWLRNEHVSRYYWNCDVDSSIEEHEVIIAFSHLGITESFFIGALFYYVQKSNEGSLNLLWNS